MEEWFSEVLEPLAEYIQVDVDPRKLFGDMREVAEGQYGLVYAASVLHPTIPPTSSKVIAIKSVPISDKNVPKIKALERELKVMSKARHVNVLSMDVLYVDMKDDALWIQMELMERSLADVLALYESGLVIGEGLIAGFATDVLQGLQYLQSLKIAHRDVRSDNMLIGSDGVLKLADFTHAVHVPKKGTVCQDRVGVGYWQAPEIRSGSYDPLKVDVWGLGATVWELAEGVPPFDGFTDEKQLAKRWPALSRPEDYSRSFHSFLRSCSEPSTTRPAPHDLLCSSFIKNASARSEVVTLLTQCRTIEEDMSR
ncbi:kinase-like protein [Sistotremastrum niveocremeum HHB9708]|uniref:Kinase-like protein n=1 Tax=Sistotremastrum niveocremeum HHB9708 TaxID=1314777 RepID=A0A164Q6V2_9AGAM|nr:kinase-like protein [Sistotremastrum niveocremeum HHB9708]